MVWDARLQLAYDFDGVRTRPIVRKHVGPLRIQKGFAPEGDAVWHQIVVHPPGGIASGDRLSIEIDLQPYAHVLLTSPGAAKWYRARTADSAGPAGAQQRLQFVVQKNATLEWLPMESLFFDSTQAALHTTVDLEPGARFMGLDVSCLGRPSAGEAFANGQVSMLTEVRQDGRLLFHESARLDAQRREAIAGLARAPAWGSLVCAGPTLVESLNQMGMRPWQERLAAQGLAATVVNGLLVVRWRGDRADHGMRLLRHVWVELRPIVTGRAAVAPRIWST